MLILQVNIILKAIYVICICIEIPSSESHFCCPCKWHVCFFFITARRAWTLEEQAAVNKHFKKQISKYAPPKKDELLKCLTEERDVLQDRDIVQLRAYIHNLYKRKKREAKKNDPFREMREKKWPFSRDVWVNCQFCLVNLKFVEKKLWSISLWFCDLVQKVCVSFFRFIFRVTLHTVNRAPNHVRLLFDCTFGFRYRPIVKFVVCQNYVT